MDRSSSFVKLAFRVRCIGTFVSALALSAAAFAAEPSPSQSAAASSTAAPPSAPPASEAPAPRGGLRYRSAWSAYRSWSEAEKPSWREVNDNVARVGGWRAYLRQVREAGGKRSGHDRGSGQDSHDGAHGGGHDTPDESATERRSP